MAFDRPIEADNIDGGIISSFVRAPIVGIAWVLGGLLLDENKENDGITTNRAICTSSGSHDEEHKSNNQIISPQTTAVIGSGRPASYFGDNRECDSSDGNSFNTCKQTSSSESNQSDGTEGTMSPHPSHLYAMRKKTRKMSWSDESGQDLVEYYEDKSNMSSNKSGSGLLNAQSESLQNGNNNNRRPIKSAIRHRHGNKHNCIPSMGGSIVMNGAGTVVGAVGNQNHNQTKNHAGGPNSMGVGNGYVSPQWGWYISTTPPTPEYHSNGSRGQVLSHHTKNMNMNTNNPQAANTNISSSQYGRHWNPTTDTILESETAPKPVFRKAHPHASGWPTVPL